MNKPLRILLGVCAVLLITALVIANRRGTAAADDLAAKGTLTVVAGGKELVYDYDESSDSYRTFPAKMTRRNGDSFDKEYSGIELSAILGALGIDIAEGSSVRAVCADNYEVELTGAEILDPGNIYIVTREGGEPLPEGDGPFMMVICHDEFSTRWAKQIVKISVD